MLTKAQHELMFGNGTLDRSGKPSWKWPNGIVPYEMSPHFNAVQKSQILKGIAYLNENLKGCVEIR